jgi:hypothetical protein
MKYEYQVFKKQLEDLKETLISEMIKHCLNDKALEIEFDNGILHAYFDDQINQVICRLNVEQRVAVVDDTYNTINIKLDDLTLDELLSMYAEIEKGNYEIWEEIAD